MPLFGRRRPSAEENQELQVVAAILAATADPRSRRYYEQVARGKRDRRATANGFVVNLESSTVEAPELGADVTSNWVSVRDATSGQALEFRVELVRAGVFKSLEGRAPGGAWPKAWQVDGAELAQAAAGKLRLPAMLGGGCLGDVGQWLGIVADPRLEVSCFEPLGDAGIAAVVAGDGMELPDGVAGLLAITDGLTIGDLRVYGARDLFVADLDGEQWWVVADEDEGEQRYIAAPGHPTVLHVPSHDAPRDRWPDTGLDFRGWLASRLRSAIGGP